MTKVGMLYICTGKYTVFWPEFYRTFYEKFLPNCEKEYFVFTDAPAIEYEDAPGVHRIYQEPYPWPYSTLKRFSIFLTQETVLSKMDYLFFFTFRAASTAARPRRFWRSAMSWSAAPRPTCNKMSSPFGMMKAS